MSLADNTSQQWDVLYLEALWSGLQGQINPFGQVLCLEGPIYRTLHDGARDYIANKFMEHIGQSVIYVLDGNGPDRVYLGAPRHFLAGSGKIFCLPGDKLYWTRDYGAHTMNTAESSSNSEPKKEVTIRRPPNAYILYRKERHHLVKNSNPKITNNEISQILGKAWNLETPEIRLKYKIMSDDLKKALLEKHPDYQYRPRRPSERRRRRRTQKSPEDNEAGLDGPSTSTSGVVDGVSSANEDPFHGSPDFESVMNELTNDF
ncbi:hypothetical protein CDD82_5275 [Ophiocordyceps australis]|uniref:HMG box domain-containing protein n=1 Tax=Ophiocordyceps australis TaxID=1399860 RepID=A0A2C5Y437_9HYPO|nr:hypothetical protein CDD82_5275 [Ophiocordyceps australis]